MSSPGPGLLATALDTLSDWRPDAAGQDGLRRDYLAFLAAAGAAGLARGAGPSHLTASCFVLSEDRERILLSLHKKGGFWVQFGGHLEAADGSLQDAALREAREESGLPELILASPAVFDLHRHDLAGSFGSCREHLDVAFVSLCPSTAEPSVSEESDDVAWWPVDDLPPGTVEDLTARVPDAARWARALASF